MKYLILYRKTKFLILKAKIFDRNTKLCNQNISFQKYETDDFQNFHGFHYLPTLWRVLQTEHGSFSETLLSHQRNTLTNY